MPLFVFRCDEPRLSDEDECMDHFTTRMEKETVAKENRAKNKEWHATTCCYPVQWSNATDRALKRCGDPRANGSKCCSYHHKRGNQFWRVDKVDEYWSKLFSPDSPDRQPEIRRINDTFIDDDDEETEEESEEDGEDNAVGKEESEEEDDESNPHSEPLGSDGEPLDGITLSDTSEGEEGDDKEESKYTFEDFYTDLDITPTATQHEIKKAYYRLAKQWHPDKHIEDKAKAEEMFKKIQKAYDVLSDVVERQKFDKTFDDGFIVDDEVDDDSDFVPEGRTTMKVKKGEGEEER